MPDIFSRSTDAFGGSFSADDGTITFPGILDGGNGSRVGADVGLLIQRMSMGYQQQVTRLYEVGRSAIYYVGGRTSGDIGIDRVVGPRTIQQAFYATYGNICNARTNALQFELTSGCRTGLSFGDGPQRGRVAYSAGYCVIMAIGVNVAAADMLINESLRIMFSTLQYTAS